MQGVPPHDRCSRDVLRPTEQIWAYEAGYAPYGSHDRIPQPQPRLQVPREETPRIARWWSGSPSWQLSKQQLQPAGLWALLTLRIKPIAPSMPGITRCQRRSRCRSELRPIRTMLVAATRYGAAVRKPTLRTLFTPLALMRLGSQKLTP